MDVILMSAPFYLMVLLVGAWHNIGFQCLKDLELTLPEVMGKNKNMQKLLLQIKMVRQKYIYWENKTFPLEYG